MVALYLGLGITIFLLCLGATIEIIRRNFFKKDSDGNAQERKRLCSFCEDKKGDNIDDVL